ncbi:MAG: phosphoenolpyruvate--protein phosphotransferase [Planctomycetes bacterium]|nr:phosphoenolpyruvate--protein phosphotransferase [Planctomycetota bacterium]NOG55005.1 phosphoenolpyruvate--protein phosphotransferase [Planctomycetota bacterium]
MKILKGIGVSPGVIIGRAFVLDDITEHVPRRLIPADDVQHQQDRLRDAVANSIAELSGLRERVATEVDLEAANILDFHIGLLSDAHFIDPILTRIDTEHVTAQYAVTKEIQALADRFLEMDHEAFRSKVSDLMDLDRRLLRHLIGETRDRLRHLSGEAVLIARDLTPSQTVGLDTAHTKAISTDAGGRTSHTSIMARSLGIPAVVGLGRAVAETVDDDQVIVDGDQGMLIIHPNEKTLERYRQRIDQHQAYKISLRDLADLPAKTLDGERINLYGNIEFASEVEIVKRNGGDGVGLFRSEFLYLAYDREPSVEEHYDAYSTAVRLSEGRPLTIRTLDLGSDKYTQSRAVSPERNPALGCRSIRYCLQHLPLFKRQVRALLQASALGPLRIMFPLVTSPSELRQARMVVHDIMEDLDDEGIEYDPNIPIGIMVEAPSAALMSHIFAREVDFMSIGTNDLIQYTLAVDRTNERVANLYSAAHPSILRLIKDVIRAGRRHDVEVSLCGEIASDTDYVMLLLGLGLRSLSLVPSAIPDVKRIIRSVELSRCQRIARRAGSFDSDRQVLNYIREETRKVTPDGDRSGRSGD